MSGTEITVTGVVACPFCRADVPVVVRVTGNVHGMSGAFWCAPCQLAFRVPSHRVKAAMEAHAAADADLAARLAAAL